MLSLTTRLPSLYLGLWWRYKGFDSAWDVILSTICFGVLPYAALFLFNFVRAPYLLHGQLLHENALLRAKLEPRQGQIDLSIVALNIAVPPSPPNSTAMALNVTVSNSGAPTVATDYRLRVIVPNRSPQEAIFLSLGQRKELIWASKSGEKTIIPEKYRKKRKS